MARSGPVPARRDELVDQRPSRTQHVTGGVLMSVSPRKADRKWHPTAKRMYEAIKASGQSFWFQQTDWEMAYSLCEDLSAYKRQQDEAVRARALRAGWDAEAASLKPSEREARGFTRDRPPLLRDPSSQRLATIYMELGKLGMSESERRRAGIELRPDESGVVPASVSVLNGYRERLRSA